jgi:hypothetical protein
LEAVRTHDLFLIALGDEARSDYYYMHDPLKQRDGIDLPKRNIET